MNVNLDRFAERLRAARQRVALAQTELGELAHISASTIVELEAGRRRPHPSTIRALARVLGVKPADLVA